MKRLLLLLSLLFPAIAMAQGTAAIQNHCYLGGTQAKVSGLSSTNYQQGIVPSCTVTVYLTGTQTKATIFSNVSGTPLANPFTANASSSSDPGGWIFWAAVNTGYDIVMSGGISPNTYSTPVTLTDQYPSFSFSGGGGSVTPCGTNGLIQTANSSGTALNCDPNFFIDPVAHELHSQANATVNALTSIPRAVYDPMDTKFDGGLAAAIAGTSGFTPAQVIQAAIDYGECQIQTNATTFKAINIPFPGGVTINLSGIKLWPQTSIGGDFGTLGPGLQHNDSTQPMITSHVSGDTIVCNGTTYTPPGPSSEFVHNVGIAGMGAVNTDTDIGILMNAAGSVVSTVWGFGQKFGGPGVMTSGQSDFMQNIGAFGGQVQGCLTYNTGVRPVSGFTVGLGYCASVYDGSQDGGADQIYASDGVPLMNIGNTNGAGLCYPNCSAFIAASNYGRDTNLFLQVSSQGLLVLAAAEKIENVRLDYMSREGIKFSGFGASAIIKTVTMNSMCTDTALSANYAAGTPTGCFGINVGAGTADISGITNQNGGIFPSEKMQAQVSDGKFGLTGISNSYKFGSITGNPDNQTSNDWLIVGNSGQTVGPEVYWPTRPPYQYLGNSSTPNVSGITSLWFTGTNQVVTNFIGQIVGQRLMVMGNATIKNGTNIQNLNGLDNVVTCSVSTYCFNALEYIYSGTSWIQVSGPPNITPTHVNYGGQPTPSNPSLVDVYGNYQARQVPGFNLNGGTGAVQLHGPNAPSGQACFVEEWLYPDGSHVVSAQTCTSVDISAQTAGEIFVVFPNGNGTATPQATVNLWMVSNTEPNGIATGMFPPHTVPPGASLWDGPTTVAAGGNGATPPTPGDNDTGEYLAPFGVLLGTSGTQPPCTVEYRGLQWVIQGSGSTPDVEQVCAWTGTAYGWVSLSTGSGGVTGSGTTGYIPLWSGATALTNSDIDDGVTTANTITAHKPVAVNDSTGNGGSWTGTEGTQPSTAGAGVDSIYADSTNHAILGNFNNGGWKQVPLYPVGTNSPPLQWYSFNSTTFAATNTSGFGSELVTAPSSTATIDRVDMVLVTAPAGCTTSAVVTLYDVTTPTSPVELSPSFEMTLVNGTRFYTYTPGTPFALTTGHNLMWGIMTAAAGCTTSPAAPSWTVTYTVK